MMEKNTSAWLKDQSGDACEFDFDCTVVPLQYALDTIAAERADGFHQGRAPTESDLAYWLSNREAILDAIETAGFRLLSNKDGFWLSPRPGNRCVCGNPTKLGSVHRTDGPCYVAEEYDIDGNPIHRPNQPSGQA